jgi:hypothetical protein
VDKEWLKPHAAYSASKIAMAFVSRRLQSELFSSNVACNTLWPRFAVATAATAFIGGERLVSMSRTPACVADAAFRIVTAPSRLVQNKHFVDQDVLRAAGVDDFKPYNVDPDVVEPVDDFFLVSNERGVSSYAKPPPPDLSSGDVVLNVAKSAEAERLEKERRDVVLVLVDARDVKAYVALFSCAHQKPTQPQARRRRARGRRAGVARERRVYGKPPIREPPSHVGRHRCSAVPR